MRQVDGVTPYLSDHPTYLSAMIQRACLAFRFARLRLDELNGYVELDMPGEALRVAQDYLQQTVISAELFEASVNVVLSAAEDLNAWKPIVQAAYHRMNTHGRGRGAPRMFWFHAASGNYREAVPFIPRKFSGPFAFVNLLLAMSTYLNLERLDKAQRLIPRCRRAARVASHPEMRSMLTDVLDSYHRELDLLRAQRRP